MIVLAVLSTIAAVVWAFLVVGANGMRSSPGPFEGGFSLFGGFVIAAAFWVAWWIG